MIVTEKSMRAAYRFLKSVAFRGVPVPAISRVRFYPFAHGPNEIAFHAMHPHRIWITPEEIRSFTSLLKAMAHEMCHAALDEHAPCDTSDHGVLFRNLAVSVEQEMHWPKGSV